MRRIFAVTEYIFKQSFRNKILNILIIFAVFAIGFSLAISELAQESEVKMVTDFGLFAISIFAFLTLVLSMTVQLFEETELKTISMIMVKPVKRHEYIIGKFLGISATVLMNVVFMLVVLMLIIALRHGDPWDIRLFLAAFYSLLGAVIMTSTALLLSMFATTVPSCVIYLVFTYALGHLTIHLKNIVAVSGNAAVKFIVDIVYYIIPNMELFNLKDKVFSPEGIFNPIYLGLVLAYSLLYIAITLSITSVIFEKKEF
jgi:ABC-type transport system involved in multi-copper enzyme maturation permease subunit